MILKLSWLLQTNNFTFYTFRFNSLNNKKEEYVKITELLKFVIFTYKRVHSPWKPGYTWQTNKSQIMDVNTSNNISKQTNQHNTNLLSISGIAFSTAFFWMKAHASSTLSLAMSATVGSMLSSFMTLRPSVIRMCFRWFLMLCNKWSLHKILWRNKDSFEKLS